MGLVVVQVKLMVGNQDGVRIPQRLMGTHLGGEEWQFSLQHMEIIIVTQNQYNSCYMLTSSP